MSRTAVCTGSFDPVTCGHEDIVERASALFDKVWVCVLVNDEKNPVFSLKEREQMCREVFGRLSNVEVLSYEGLAADIFVRLGAEVIIRGVRGPEDLGYEMMMADVNKGICSRAETLFMPCSEQYRGISSSKVKELAGRGQDLSGYVPECIKDKILQRLI